MSKAASSLGSGFPDGTNPSMSDSKEAAPMPTIMGSLSTALPPSLAPLPKSQRGTKRARNAAFLPMELETSIGKSTADDGDDAAQLRSRSSTQDRVTGLNPAPITFNVINKPQTHLNPAKGPKSSKVSKISLPSGKRLDDNNLNPKMKPSGGKVKSQATVPSKMNMNVNVNVNTHPQKLDEMKEGQVQTTTSEVPNQVISNSKSFPLRTFNSNKQLPAPNSTDRAPILIHPMKHFELVSNHGLMDIRNISLPIPPSSATVKTTASGFPIIHGEFENVESVFMNMDSEYMGAYSCRYISQYKQICQLGNGTYGTVYLSVDKLTGIAYAVKKLQISASDSGFHYTSLREIATLRACKHPNIVEIKDVVVGRQPERVYIVLDLCVTDVERIISNPTQASLLTLGQIKTYTLQILAAIAALHRRFIIHRDLKPSNLLIDRDGVLRVTDFGLARFISHPLPS